MVRLILCLNTHRPRGLARTRHPPHGSDLRPAAQSPRSLRRSEPARSRNRQEVSPLSQQHDTPQSAKTTDEQELGATPSDGLFERLDSSDQLFEPDAASQEASSQEAASPAPGEPAVLIDEEAQDDPASPAQVVELSEQDPASHDDKDSAPDDPQAQEIKELRARFKRLHERHAQLEGLHGMLERRHEQLQQEHERRVSALDKQLEEIVAERDELKNRLMRSAADLENFRKRKEREKEELRRYGSDRLVLEILPAVDNLERALEHASKTEEGSTIADGVRMVLRQLLAGLDKHGVKGFSSHHERFDPQRHEAIQQIETTEHETGTVMQEFQKGYFLHERLLRPALVVVAKNVAPEPPATLDITPDPAPTLDPPPEQDAASLGDQTSDSSPVLEEISSPEPA